MKKQYAVFGLGSFGESVAIELQKYGACGGNCESGVLCYESRH